jgi:hypothetical protein
MMPITDSDRLERSLVFTIAAPCHPVCDYLLIDYSLPADPNAIVSTALEEFIEFIKSFFQNHYVKSTIRVLLASDQPFIGIYDNRPISAIFRPDNSVIEKATYSNFMYTLAISADKENE